MNIDHLVELVYQELTKRLSIKEKSQSVCIISTEPIQELELFYQAYDVNYFSAQLESQEFDEVMIPRLSISMLGNLANGLGTTAEEQFILRQLLSGKRVVALQSGIEYHHYKEHSPILLYKVYEEYEQKLEGFGVSFITLNEKGRECVKAEKVQPKHVEASETSFLLTKKLVTESDLQKLYLQNIKDIIVSKTSIITPLANDFIRTHKLIITRERG